MVTNLYYLQKDYLTLKIICMKTFLRLTFILIVATAFTGCYKKDVYIQDPVIGSWVLDNASRANSYGWQTFYAGIENGVLDFYSNGSATYNENHVSLTGNWYISNSNGGYYDESGYYRTGSHQTLYVHLYDSYSNSTIDLNFGYVAFQNNRFVATDYYAGAVEKYEFSRY